ESLINGGDMTGAAAMLEQSARLMNRKEMQAGQIGARFNYVTARLAFAQGKLAAGHSALAACMAYQKNASRRLFQISLAEGLYTSGQIRVDRVAEQLYDEVLRESQSIDRTRDPMEAMTVAMTPHIT